MERFGVLCRFTFMNYVEFPESTAVAWAAYNGPRHLLYVAYRENMRTYEYERVPPRIWERLLAADSKGIYVNLFIKPVYDFREVTDELGIA